MAGADTSAPGAGFEIVDRDVCYDGFFRLDRVRLRFRLYSGGWSRVIEREVFDRGSAACVLLYDPDRDRVVLVEQFRAAAIGVADDPWLIETVAGIVEPDEATEDLVRREAVEEADCTLEEVIRVGEVLLSPGASTERLTLYCGRVDASKAGGIHGLAAEGEDIRVMTLTLDEALAAVADGSICVANAVIALQWLALNRDRVRAAWLPGR